MTSKIPYRIFFPDRHSDNSDLQLSRIPCLRRIKPTQAFERAERGLSLPAEEKKSASHRTQQILAPVNIVRPVLSVTGARVRPLILHLQKDSEIKSMTERFHPCASVLATTLSTEKKRIFDTTYHQKQTNVRLKRREHCFRQNAYQSLPDFAEISINTKHRCRRIVKLPSISLSSSVFSLPEPSAPSDETWVGTQ